MRAHEETHPQNVIPIIIGLKYWYAPSLYLRPLRNKDFLLALFSSDADLLIRFRNSQILDLFVSVPRPFLFVEVVALFLFFFALLYNCSRHQRIAKSFTQNLPLGKGLSYVVTRACILRCLRNMWHLPSGGCHAFFWTYIYILEKWFPFVRE